MGIEPSSLSLCRCWCGPLPLLRTTRRLRSLPGRVTPPQSSLSIPHGEPSIISLLHFHSRHSPLTSLLPCSLLLSRWLVEDYAAFVMLQRHSDPDAVLGVVDAVYSIALSLDSYCRDK